MSQPQQQQPSYPPPPVEPTFQVRTVKHTGALIFWLNQRYTTTGTYAQCQAAIDQAQQHCILAGWWSIASLLWNPISLSQNASARKTLRQQAQQAPRLRVVVGDLSRRRRSAHAGVDSATGATRWALMVGVVTGRRHRIAARPVHGARRRQWSTPSPAFRPVDAGPHPVDTATSALS